MKLGRSQKPEAGSQNSNAPSKRPFPAFPAGYWLLASGFFLGALCYCADAPPVATAYSNDFEKLAPGKPPEEFMLLNGTFNVVQIDGNKCLELDPDPIDNDGLLFGPPGMVTGTVGARIWASASGRRFPEIGIGSNDAGGYKLILLPAQGILELRKGDESVASAGCGWKSDTWTHLRLHIEKLPDGKYQIQGKAWPDGTAEPAQWAITTNTEDAPYAGRASVWGMPYSEKPIRFDDLSYEPK